MTIVGAPETIKHDSRNQLRPDPPVEAGLERPGVAFEIRLAATDIEDLAELSNAAMKSWVRGFGRLIEASKAPAGET